MRSYEMMMILRSTLDETAIEGVLEKISAIITSRNGEIAKVEKWGKRRLAYEVNENTDGFYVVMDFKAGNDATTEVDRVLKITDEVVRFLLVRKEEE